MPEDDIRQIVRDGYASVAKKKRENCCSTSDLCCQDVITPDNLALGLGYGVGELKSIPENANMGLGCGNPTAFASLNEGETVVDLGSGGGIDCFLASARVGKSGRVIGVDMTPEMIERAKSNAVGGEYENVEFRLGEIEKIPVEDNTADCIISNCVINLSPDKARVFSDAFRILKPGGRLMLSDIVLTTQLPESLRESITAYVGCIAGAIRKDDYLSLLKAGGFEEIDIVGESYYFGKDNEPMLGKYAELFGIPVEELRAMSSSVLSLNLKARKPVA